MDLHYVILFISPIFSTVASSDGQCIWYDTCGWDQDYGPDGGNGLHFLNCHYEGPAKPATQEQVELIKGLCPHLYSEGEDLNLCCSMRQLKDLQMNFVTPKALIEELCPTCWYNFRKNFCDMTCSDQQSTFVHADRLVEGPGFDNGYNNYTGQNVTMVKSVTYFAHVDFVIDTYESCKDVQFPAVSDTIMYMLCGSWGSEHCNPFKWFDFLGSVDNGYVPFLVNYDYSNKNTSSDGHKYHNPEIIPCSFAAPGYSIGCGCENCPSACNDGECIWYDTCGWDPDYGIDGGNGIHYLNCHYTGPAKLASDEQVQLVKEVCPHLHAEEKELTLCCSMRQLMDLKTYFETPEALMSSCPTCLHNFKRNFCDMTCSNQQSKFIRADNIVTGPGFDNGYENYEGQTVAMVKDVTYFAHEDFVTSTYDSCKNIQFPALSDTIMSVLCGSWGSTHCNPFRWFDFMGSLSNGCSPFQVWYEYSEEDLGSDDEHKYHNPEVFPCQEVAPEFSSACACMDCPLACE